MSPRILLALFLSLALAACGVKNNLDVPQGVTQDSSEPDPSRPPQPLGQ